MKFLIETYGCQMNSAESNALEVLFKGAGWEMTDDQNQADVAIINTCSVRQSAENRIWGRLGSYTPVKKKRKIKLILTGCMAERLGEEAKKLAPQIDYVVPINDKLNILKIAEEGFDFSSKTYEFTDSYYKEGDFSSYVPIMNGCNNFCSYCIVPYVRGREVSRDFDRIIDEVKMLDSKGVKEITLLGQNVNSYNYNGILFPQLLEKVCSVCSNIQWVRFESPHPKDFSDELIEVIASQPRVAKHLHIPMQSGSTQILKQMNRRYSREQYLELINKIKKRIPGITFAVDVMVGFPGETEADLQQTISAMEDAGYIEAYMYYYNPREGTRAVEMDGQIPQDEKQKRLQRVIDFQLENAASIKSLRACGVQKVLVTGVSRDNRAQMIGHNEHMEMVAFNPKDTADTATADTVGTVGTVEVGSMVDVQFLMLNGNTFVGKQI